MAKKITMTKKKNSKRQRLTVRERKFIMGLADGKSQTQAAKDAGYSKKTAYSIASEKLKKPDIQQSLQALMETRGLSDDRLLSVVEDGLQAQKAIGYLHQYKKGEDGRVEGVKPDEVMSNDFIEYPDHSTRHKYLVTALELRGHIKKVNGDQIIQIFVTQEGVEAKRAKIDRAKEAGIIR